MRAKSSQFRPVCAQDPPISARIRARSLTLHLGRLICGPVNRRRQFGRRAALEFAAMKSGREVSERTSMTFSELGLDPKIIKAVEESGYTTPTPIQEKAIPHALARRDVLGIAQTGTGKPAPFTLPMIHTLARGRARARMPRSLILCPTRELAAQVAENFESHGKYHKLSMALLIGGVNFAPQEKLIDRGVDVLIATPGRLIDHFERGKLMLTGIQIMVVDEADRMLDMGFIPDIEKIFNLTPFTRQTLFFSATMPPEITRLTEAFLSNPVRVEAARQATTAATVSQNVLELVPTKKERIDREKRAALRALIAAEGEEFRNAIVFCNRKRDIGILFRSLERHGHSVGALHGDLDQSVRMATLNAFRDGQVKVLVASDVAARGLDIPNVSHVFNYDVPTHAEDYVHRIGRTGRAGRTGTAFTIALPHEAKYIEAIEKIIDGSIPRAELPAEALESQRPERRSRRRQEKVEVEAPADKTAAEATKPARTKADAPAAERASRPARERERTSDRGGAERGAERSAERSADRTPERARNERQGRSQRGGRENQDAVVGMGDHVPAFLLRPVPSRRPARDTEPKADAA